MTDITREQWMAANCLASALNVVNAPFCDDQPALTDPSYIENVATEVLRRSSPMAIEDTIRILERSLEIASTNYPPKYEEPKLSAEYEKALAYMQSQIPEN